jgi:hypothetical protein
MMCACDTPWMASRVNRASDAGRPLDVETFPIRWYDTSFRSEFPQIRGPLFRGSLILKNCILGLRGCLLSSERDLGTQYLGLKPQMEYRLY